MQEIAKVILYLIIFIIVLWASYKVSKMLSQHSIGYATSKHMKLIDRMMITKDSALQIIQIGEQYMLVSISNGKIEMLKDLQKSDLIEMKKEEFQQNQVYTKADSLLKELVKNVSTICEKGKQNSIDFLNSKKSKKNNNFSNLVQGKIDMKKQKTITESDSVVDDLLKSSIKRTNYLKNKSTIDEGENIHED